MTPYFPMQKVEKTEIVNAGAGGRLRPFLGSLTGASNGFSNGVLVIRAFGFAFEPQCLPDLQLAVDRRAINAVRPGVAPAADQHGDCLPPPSPRPGRHRCN